MGVTRCEQGLYHMCMAGALASSVPVRAPSLRQACEQGLEQVLNKALSPVLRPDLILQGPTMGRGPALPGPKLGTVIRD